MIAAIGICLESMELKEAPPPAASDNWRNCFDSVKSQFRSLAIDLLLLINIGGIVRVSAIGVSFLRRCRLSPLIYNLLPLFNRYDSFHLLNGGGWSRTDLI